MSVRSVIKYGDKVLGHHLTTPSTPVIPEDDPAEVAQLIKDLVDTVNSKFEKVQAAGLAAPQIGVNKRVIIVNYAANKDLIMINPVIIEATGRMKHDEMCLSFPMMKRRKTRKQFIKVEFMDRFWNPKTQVFTGMDAFIVQHEMDHLDGRTLADE